MQRRTILIIDDNGDHRSIYTTLLERHGYAVLTAPDASSGVAMARVQQPDLVLLDVRMPGVDGLAAARQLADAEETAGLRVVLFSMYLDDDAEAVRAAPCFSTMPKPSTAADLVTAVNRLVGSPERP